VRRRLTLLLALLALVLAAWLYSRSLPEPAAEAPFRPGGAARSELPLESLKLPPGFSATLFGRAAGARQLALGPGGAVYVGSRGSEVQVLVDGDGDGRAEVSQVLARGLNNPNGVAWHQGSLYVGEIPRIVRFDGLASDPTRAAEPVLVSDAFPQDGHHGLKYIRFGPDGLLYVPVGAPCNVCLPPNDLFAALHRMRPDGSGLETVARGIRNTVGFDWHPDTKELWFTDNGRDYLGDDLPPDELNRCPRSGLHFGFPFVYGSNVPDPEFGKDARLSDYTPPARNLGPHVASLGMRFYTGRMFPEEYRGCIFIAEHGSWNRSQPIGARLTRVRLEDGKPVSYEVFAEGFQTADGRRWGRPVDLEVLPDGSMLVSDDHAGAVYRISYRTPQRRL
jgi:glucose/arabinose dehydrogenase